MFPSKMSSGQFQEVIQLVSDPVLLGNTLLHMAKTKATKNSDTFEGKCCCLHTYVHVPTYHHLDGCRWLIKDDMK